MLKILLKLDQKLDGSLGNIHCSNKQYQGPKNTTGKNKRFRDKNKNRDQNERGWIVGNTFQKDIKILLQMWCV